MAMLNPMEEVYITLEFMSNVTSLCQIMKYRTSNSIWGYSMNKKRFLCDFLNSVLALPLGPAWSVLDLINYTLGYILWGDSNSTITYGLKKLIAHRDSPLPVSSICIRQGNGVKVSCPRTGMYIHNAIKTYTAEPEMYDCQLGFCGSG
jgi:hypothetical protein